MTNTGKKLISSLLAACLLTVSGIALAASDPGQPPCPGPGGPSQQRPQPPDMVKQAQTALGKLVKDQTITPEQSDKILVWVKEKEEQRKADFEQTKNMSPEERDRYFRQHHKGEHPDLIKDLMDAAKLTESQAKSVADAIRPPMPPGEPRPPQ